MGIYQFQFITRNDDVCNFKVDDPKGNETYEMALSQSVKWSKNVKDTRNCPDQLLLAAKDHRHCMFLSLGLWLEYFLNNHPDATYMMSPGMPESRSKEAHKKFTKAISKTYRNQWERHVLKNLDFTRIYKGNDKRPLGLHSKRKSGSTQAKKRGAGRDQVDHCGRWVTKKGSQIVNKVYIDPEDVYADALCASVLAIGGPIHYKVKPALSRHVTANWLAVHMVPGIAKRKTQDLGIIRDLGLALLWLAHDEEASDDLAMPDVMKKRIKDAYSDLPRQDKPYQPVEKFALHVYRHGEKTVIEEVAPLRAQSQEGQQPQNLADALAGIPASGGSAATQQMLQTLVIQQRNLQQQLHDMQQVWSTTDQRNRDWLENKFRTLNDNIRKFGGTIQGGLLRQD
jgi:hypothetical protein